MAIWLSSDWHFGHDREFLWGPRGFKSIEEHDEAIIERHNSLVAPEDTVIVCGDLMLNNNEHGLDCLSRLNGKFIVVRGNHDTDARWNLYRTNHNIVSLTDVHRFKYGKYKFYCSHYPTLTGNLEKEGLRQVEINLFGHTHQQTNFYEDRPYMYHTGLDSHNCYPVNIDDIINDCEAKVKECIDML